MVFGGQALDPKQVDHGKIYCSKEDEGIKVRCLRIRKA